LLGDAGVAGGALPGAGVTAPGAGATVVGFAGVTAVPPGDSDWPAAVVPPCGTDGPVGTLGAPGSDDVGDSAIGEGVVNEGTPRDGAPEVTRFPDLDRTDGSTVERSLWSAPGKHSVALYTVEGGGHGVPHPAVYGPRLLA